MTLKRLGIDWGRCASIVDWNASPPIPLYGGQLPVNAGSSTNVKIYRAGTSVATATEIARV